MVGGLLTGLPIGLAGVIVPMLLALVLYLLAYLALGRRGMVATPVGAAAWHTTRSCS